MRIIFIFAAAFFFFLFAAAKDSFPGLRNNVPKKKAKKTVNLIVTAYYKPLPNQKKYATGSYKGDLRLNGSGRTFSGKEASEDFAAADITILPIGTIIKVPGHKVVQVEDTGGDIKGEKLDIFMGSGDEGLEKALEWGIKKIKVEVLK